MSPVRAIAEPTHGVHLPGSGIRRLHELTHGARYGRIVPRCRRRPFGAPTWWSG
ncbi:hypothetical protein OG280_36330 [Streptomyces virginiae]|uniref:hypothetical protein n=1 Tax=Streptomyces virginiae TaxID=1961 RepID=UPI003254AD9A